MIHYLLAATPAGQRRERHNRCQITRHLPSPTQSSERIAYRLNTLWEAQPAHVYVSKHASYGADKPTHYLPSKHAVGVPPECGGVRIHSTTRRNTSTAEQNYLLPLHVIGSTIGTFAVRLQPSYQAQHGYFRRDTYKLHKRSEVPIARGREVTQC